MAERAGSPVEAGLIAEAPRLGKRRMGLLIGPENQRPSFIGFSRRLLVWVSGTGPRLSGISPLK